ncbi:MAG: type IV pilin N-terminal domain-containing protein [Methanosarcina sp.]|nr:type IV pilin N-terminal domain-containing protein [Methanosarcina sp.]
MDRVTADVERGRWTGMFDEKKLMKNQKAVSEVVGEVLLTTIAVLLVSSIGIFIATYDGATDIPHTQVREWMSAGKDTIYLEHSGGEFLGTESFEIAVNINGTKYVYPSARTSITAAPGSLEIELKSIRAASGESILQMEMKSRYS